MKFEKKPFYYLLLVLWLTFLYHPLFAQLTLEDKTAALRSHRSSPKDLLVLITAIAILVLISFVVSQLNRKKNSKEENLIILKRFAELADKRKYNPNEIALIKKLASLHPHVRLDELVTKREIFNDIVIHYISGEMNSMSDNRKNDIYDLLTSIRRKSVLHVPMPYTPIVSTKELPLSLPLTLQVGTKLFKSVVLDNVEECILAEAPEGLNAKHFHPGENVLITFYRKTDGHYKIKSKVKRIITEPMNAIALEHANKLSGSIKRKSVRAKYCTNCYFHPIDKKFYSSGEKSLNEELKGETMDFSNGGLFLRSDKRLDVGSYMIVRFDISAKFRFKNIKAKIIKMRKNAHDYSYNLMFMGLSKEDDTKLRHAVSSVNRKES